MDINQYAEKHGAHKTARAIINKRIMKICGLGLSDLPDTPELCDLSDELADLIEANPGRLLDPEIKAEIAALINETINDDNIESLLLG
jgi:hypothetical protein